MFIRRHQYILSSEPRILPKGPLANVITTFCKESKFPTDSYNFYKTERSNNNPNALLDDENPPIVLFGSSFSSSNLGIDSFLRYNFGSEVTNAQLGGGIALGSMLDYLSTSANILNGVKLIIWEFPVQAEETDLFGSLSALSEYKQILPAIRHPGELIYSNSNTEKKYIFKIDYSEEKKLDSRDYYYARISFENNTIRNFDVVFDFGKQGTYLTNLRRNRGSNLLTYFVEINSQFKTLPSKITLNLPKDYAGLVKLELFRIVNH